MRITKKIADIFAFASISYCLNLITADFTSTLKILDINNVDLYLSLTAFAELLIIVVEIFKKKNTSTESSLV